MRHLRPTAFAGLLLAATATLSSCGFDYQTDRVNTIGAGVNERDPDVDALGIRVVSDTDGKGRLIGALANNSEEPVSLEAVTPGEATDNEQVAVDEFTPVEVAPRAIVNLTSEDLDPIRLTGDYRAGDVLELTLEYSNGEQATLNVPVVKAGCFYYEDVPLGQDSASPEAGAEGTPEAGAEASPEAGEESGHDESGHDESGHEESGHDESGHSDAYLCPSELPTPGGEGGGH